MVTFGLDISHHQDLALDLARAKRDGVSFVFLKATEGAHFTDAEFAANLAEARRANLLVGAYCFVRVGASAAAHVAHVARVVPKDVPVIPDVETALDRSNPSLALTREIVRQLRAAGYRVPLIYIPRWFWQGAWGSPSLTGLPPLWASRYPDMIEGSIRDEWADVPAHYWQGYGGLPIAVLQFTSSARVAGHAPLDVNAYRGTPQDLASLFGGEVEDDMTPEDRKKLDYMDRTGRETQRRVTLMRAELAAVAKAVAADRDLTPAQLQQMMTTAAKAATPTAAEVAAALEPLIREIVPDEQADLILEKLAEKLAATAAD